MPAKLHLGPILAFRKHDKENKKWLVSALVVADKGAKLSLASPQAQVSGPVVLKTQGSLQAIRFDLSVPLAAKQQRISYSIAGEDYDFHVPANGSPSRIAYASCNGFSSRKLMQNYQEEEKMNERWLHMQKRHRSIDSLSKLHNDGGWKSGPLHLLLMGGDQVYCDAIFEGGSAEIDKWNTSWWQFWKKDKTKAAFTNTMRAEADEFFFNKAYCHGWSRPSLAWMLARVPTIMMWDDHDIFDGWGSHPEELQQCPVWKGIFASAKSHFEVFQMQTKPGERAPESITDGNSFTRGFHLGSLAILSIDMRSERTMHQVVSGSAWKSVFNWLDELVKNEKERPRHLLVMSSIPVIYAGMRGAEQALALIPGNQELEDDLRDHWCSRLHFNEQVMLVKRLFDFASQCGCRVTILSGDVHVAAWGKVTSSLPEHLRGGRSYASRINQLISSGIVHPPPSAGQAFFIDHLLSGDPPELASGLAAELPNLPGTRARLCASRNWLSLCLDMDKSSPRLWADWWFEDEDEAPLTLVIHPVDWAGQVQEKYSSS